MLIAAAGIGPVLAGIGSLIGVLGGLLFNPVTLAALLIAVGVGGVVYGLKKLWDWGTKTDSSASAKKYVDKKKELDQRLKDAGMSRGGNSKDRTRQEIHHGKHGRTEEQEKIWKEVEAERAKLEAAKKQMEKEIKEAKKARNLDISAREKAGEKINIKEEEKKWKQTKLDIYKKFENNIGSISSSSVSNTGNGDNVTSNIDTSDVISNIGPEPSSEGNITVIPLQKEQDISASSDSAASSVDYIPSDNPNNMHILPSKIQYGVAAG